MKKLILSALSMFALTQAFAYNTQTVKDSISTSTTWEPTQQYLLKGWVYVTSGTTLTIKPGCIIRGDKNTKGTLIVERGAKIIAEGTASLPIVFTSAEEQGDRSYGDWGGVVICGQAPTNWTAGEAQVEGGPRSKYGGSDPNDNSGILRYVRIEFAGIAFSPNNEVNGLTLAGVGAGTQIDHVQVSYSGDDAYEWFGGNVNSKYLVSIGTWDDDFDTDAGYAGKNQFIYSLRDYQSADVSGSKAFESDSYLAGTVSGIGDNSKATRAVFSNVTVAGPLNTPAFTGANSQFVAAVHLRRGSAQSLLNSVFLGYPAGLLIDESSSSYGSTTANILDNSLQFRSNIIAGIPTNATPAQKEIIYVKDGARNLTPTNAYADTTTGSPFGSFNGPWNWLKASANNNWIFATENNGVRLFAPFNLSNPNPVPQSTSPISYNAKTLPAYMTPGGSDPFANGKVYPFNPAKAINTDTSGMFVNYNAPQIVPDFTTTKANDAFFDKVNYVGAFAGTQTTSDNWMKGWTNFDPNNTFYDIVSVNVNEAQNNEGNVVLFPNPARQATTLSFDVAETADVRVMMVDMAGRVVKKMYEATNAKGAQTATVDLSDVTPGVYFVSIITGEKQKVVKLSVIK
ncbi:T9SS type A sorting domain-containing protein [Polluticoccus soli]|uniref:T9SS type A sorting domain-containing protein n=1 Tax=Polluticoccus soli TaxID=3034150 RepID=UPI0023E2F16D|nr:T9SS type A sorting domain-containing protein [Flavipsychrobacter sp. JY13-12]